MAEECSLQSSSDGLPLSLKRSINLTLSPQSLQQDPSSEIDPVPDKSQFSPPKKPRSDFCGYPLTDSVLVDEAPTEKLILGEVSGVPTEVAGGINGVSGLQLVKNHDTFEGFSDGAGVGLSVAMDLCNFDGHGKSSELLSKKNDEIDEVSGVGLVKRHDEGLSYDRKGEIDEFLELKDEVSGTGRANSSVVVDLGSLESQSDGAHLTSQSKSKNGDHVACSPTMELIDETVVVEMLEYAGNKSRRNGKKADSEAVGVVGGSNGARGTITYSRKEMEKLRFVKGKKAQKKFWKEVYSGFADNVREEYDQLGSFKQNNQGNKAARKRNHCDQGDPSSGNMTFDAEIRDSTHVTFDDENSGKHSEEFEWSEDEKSDDEYQCIRRPAFMVYGEPDFESGPPEDGLEYLRRVRWEAAQIPKVKVVKLDKSKPTEQSVYMPTIPDIEKCPPHLAPSRQWEDEFIADFSELRLALSFLGDTSDAASVDSDLVIFSRPECTKRTSKSLASLELPAGGPTVSTLIAMDPVTRVALLNKRITLFESASSLSKDDCAWLFALCAVVETPLHADTSASLRCLLRRCAKLRSQKAEFDDEGIMLNILATIAGKIFGQSEN